MDYVKDLPFTGYVANRAWANTQGTAVRKFLAAYQKAVDGPYPSSTGEVAAAQEHGRELAVGIRYRQRPRVDMTLTTPNCPSAQELPIMVENAVASVAGVGEVKVNIVWTRSTTAGVLKNANWVWPLNRSLSRCWFCGYWICVNDAPVCSLTFDSPVTRKNT